jgi:hypothetical protein
LQISYEILQICKNMLTFQSLTIGAVEQRLVTKRKRKMEAQKTPAKNVKRGRHVVWTAQSDYICIKEGVPIKTEIDAEQLFRAGTLDESYFYIFKHKDAVDMDRNTAIPVYEAVYFCTDREKYVRVQKCHLKCAYSNARKTNAKFAWNVDEEGAGVPYWVDRYLCSRMK